MGWGDGAPSTELGAGRHGDPRCSSPRPATAESFSGVWRDSGQRAEALPTVAITVPALRDLQAQLEEQHSLRIAHVDGIPMVHTPSGKLTIVHQIHMSDRGGTLTTDFLVFKLHNW